MKKILFSLIIMSACLWGCSDKPYVIVQVADAQLGFTAAVNLQRNGGEYVNDLTYEAGCLRKAVDLINKLQPDAVVFTGDQVHRHDNTEQWDTLASIISGINGSIKTFHVPGNHDVIINGSTVDPSPFTSRYGEGRFIYCAEGVTFMGLNSNLIKFGDSLETEQTEWIKASLGEAGAEQPVIIFCHHPFFVTAIDEDDQSYATIASEKRRFYFDLFSELGVDAVYAGHEHESFDCGHNGIIMNTTTSVGYQLGDSQPSVRVITVKDGQISDRLVEIQ